MVILCFNSFLIFSGSVDTPFNQFFFITTFYAKKNVAKKLMASAFISQNQLTPVIGNFSHASISKIVNCPLVDIGEKFHAFIKKGTSPLTLCF